MFCKCHWNREQAAEEDEDEDEGVSVEHNSNSADDPEVESNENEEEKDEDDELAEYGLDKYDEEDTGDELVINHTSICFFYFYYSVSKTTFYVQSRDC